MHLSVYYCIYIYILGDLRAFSWGTLPSPLTLQNHYCIYQVTPRVFSWGTPPSPLTLQNAFVSVLLHYCIYRVTPRVFRWGTLPNPLTLWNAFVSVLLHNILGDPKRVQLRNTT